jgi:hypothetical protein
MDPEILNLLKQNDPYGLVNIDEITPFFIENNRLFSESEKGDNLLPDEISDECCDNIRLHIEGNVSICLNCGVKGDYDANDKATFSTPVLRLIGKNSSNEQKRDFFKGGTNNSAETQKKQIINEFRKMREDYLKENNLNLPQTAFDGAALSFNELQRNKAVVRMDNKLAIMAALLKNALMIEGAPLTNAEIADIVGLPNKGLARGTNFIKHAVSEGKISVNLNISPFYPEVNGLFNRLGLNDAKYESLKEVVLEIINHARKKFIGMNSLPRTQSIATTYIVLSRCKEMKKLELKAFCEMAKIMQNTITSYITEIDSYHSQFVELYRKHGLNEAKVTHK